MLEMSAETERIIRQCKKSLLVFEGEDLNRNIKFYAKKALATGEHD